MAGFSVLENTKSCALCEELATQKSFKKGSRVRISGAFDCENCPLYKAQPIRENEPILFLYNALPARFNFNGDREITTEDVQFIFATRIHIKVQIFQAVYFFSIRFPAAELFQASE